MEKEQSYDKLQPILETSNVKLEDKLDEDKSCCEICCESCCVCFNSCMDGCFFLGICLLFTSNK